MNKVGSYDAYVNSYQNYGTQSRTQRGSAAGKANETASAKPVELSQNAKNLLKELQHKYGNMDIIVGNFEAEEDAQAYLDRGTKDYSVLIGVEIGRASCRKRV